MKEESHPSKNASKGEVIWHPKPHREREKGSKKN
jgi:hypothetical protein